MLAHRRAPLALRSTPRLIHTRGLTFIDTFHVITYIYFDFRRYRSSTSTYDKQFFHFNTYMYLAQTINKSMYA